MLNILNTLVVIFITLADVHSAPNNRRYGRGAWAYSTEVEVRCFSGDSLVRLANGQDKQIAYLKAGDQLLTIDQSNIISTEMIMMLDKQTSKTGFSHTTLSNNIENSFVSALFYTLITKSGYEISLTEYHLIPIISLNGTENYFPAKDIQIGDYLYVFFNSTVNLSPVINITTEIKKGYYAPLTTKGTLLINNILASCFAHATNHHLAQFYMFPFRYYYKLARFLSSTDPFNNSNSDGLHWLVRIMLDFVRYFLPETLVF